MVKNQIEAGKTYLGIELGSTRIKACLTGPDYEPLATGFYEWENRFEDGYWTYSLDEVHKGIRGCFAELSHCVWKKYGIRLTTVGAIGISGMMHGYLVFDKAGRLLVPFRTWRNTTTEKASKELSELFRFHIPQRFSVAHLYQAILNGETHTRDICRITTLAGYVHYLLTGKHEVGIGEASGCFPVKGIDYDTDMIEKFDHLMAGKGYTWRIYDILPKVRVAGQKGAYLTEEGARFLDPEGNLKTGIPLCPPEGDAGTGMVATNAVLPETGNVSAGTSVFAMLVLKKPLTKLYYEIDPVTTPDGTPVAMVHCNNCCSELDAWISMFEEFARLTGSHMDRAEIYQKLYWHAMKGKADCGGNVAYNYHSGEHITGIEHGSPMCFRRSCDSLNLADFMRSQLYSAFATLKLGMEILSEEDVNVRLLQAHGGLFKVKGVAQQILADALVTPVSVMETAGEGGAWGMALLAAYMMRGCAEPLGVWLAEKVFSGKSAEMLAPDPAGVKGFAEYCKRYKMGLAAEKKLEEVTC